MLTDKELKQKFRKEFANNPEKYYPTIIKELGFSRHQCTNCGKNFWSVTQRNKCGDPACSGGFLFINNTPAKKQYSYIELWGAFSKIMEKQGYTPIKRYPIIARWRDDLFFVEASIDGFIPYVVNGEIEPPANPLVVPQLAVRFNDIDNVGITGSHNTCFIMAGQHAFYPPSQYKPNDYLQHLINWFTQGMKLPLEEIIFHEDVWAGSGNFGPCIEIFSRGLELANQVYMQYRSTENGYADLPLKVLDMGLGYERNVWFSNATSTSYETTFPTVVKELYKITGIKPDHDVVTKFLPFASFLNADEVEDINKTWNEIAVRIKTDVDILKETIMPLSALYSIADHTRALLVAINDGGLPSNVGGGYNLRVILRRALSLAEKYGWKIDFPALCKAHAKYLHPLFPELEENLDEVNEIINNEIKKYESAKKKSKEIIATVIKKGIDENTLIDLYDSNGIPPQLLAEEAKKEGVKIKVPDNFFSLVTERHRKAEKKIEHVIDVTGIPETEIRYYDLPYIDEINAKVIKILEENKVVLDKTIFYPESGGQECDKGLINNLDVFAVKRYGKVIVHFIGGELNFKEGDEVECKIDWPRRLQLSQHHTSVHIVNGAARKVLGKHVWQGGTHKSEEKATLDISHYEQISDEHIIEIEKISNEIIKKSKINKMLLSRTEAEQKYGMTIYQGGAIPHKKLRIISIHGTDFDDVEACGGTHLENADEIKQILITGSERIQDGIIRLTIVAGKAAENYKNEQQKLLKEIENILGTTGEHVMSSAKNLFIEWKKSRKKSSSAEDVHGLASKFEDNVLIEKLDASPQQIQKMSKTLSSDKNLIILFGIQNEYINVFGSSGKETTIDIGKKIGEICASLGGKGGGSRNVAQGFGKDLGKLDEIIAKVKKEIRK
ncbi:MAG TPA: alanine--tRNA ligase [archaeon]|nr:alanine--tRNA ligase [archaeon]